MSKHGVQSADGGCVFQLGGPCPPAREMLNGTGFEFPTRIRRFLICVCLVGMAGVCVAFAFPSPISATQDISVTVETTEIPFSKDDGLGFGVPFIDKNNRVQVPVRKTLEALGATVDYNASDRIVTVALDGVVLRFEIDGKARLNGESYEIDTSATIRDGRTYIPVRYAVEPFGYLVKWDSLKRDVLIRKALREIWRLPPTEAGLSMGLNGPIGLTFVGYPYEGKIEEWEFYGYDRPSVMIINRTDFNSGEDIVFEPMDFEYRIFRVTVKEDELLYSKPFPRFSGTLPAGTFTSCSIELPFWNRENLPPGDYKVQLVFPEDFVYRVSGSETLRYLPVRSNMYNEFYEFQIL
jgi:hypothetical protein